MISKNRILCTFLLCEEWNLKQERKQGNQLGRNCFRPEKQSVTLTWIRVEGMDMIRSR